MNYEDFSTDQKYYLDLLSKYSGRKMKSATDSLSDFTLSV
jgi:hypothetical protein